MIAAIEQYAEALVQCITPFKYEAWREILWVNVNMRQKSHVLQIFGFKIIAANTFDWYDVFHFIYSESFIAYNPLL